MAHRIIQIIPTLDQGGAEKQCALLALGLPRDEFDVHVCCLTRGGPWEEKLTQSGIPVTHIRKRSKIQLSSVWRLKSFLRKMKPDLVHTWLFAANAYGRVAAKLAGVPNIVAAERCVDLWKSRYHFMIDRQLAKISAAITVNGEGVRDFYAEQRINPDKLQLIHNGIELSEVEPLMEKDQLCRELGIPSDSRLIGAVGRLWPQKRFKDLIWAADLLKCVRDDTHLLIVGDGPQRIDLIRYAEQVEILDRVHFLGHQSEAARLIACLDVLWSGSHFEGLSNVVMEAIANGVPVVASDIPGHRELITHQQTGFLFPVGDRAGLARATRLLLENPNDAKTMAKLAKEELADKYRLDNMIERHIDLYRRLLERND